MSNIQNQYVFERLDAYRVAYSALAIIVRHRGTIRGLPGEIGSQLERAAVSVVANIAEATGKHTVNDRRKSFSVARAEANETGAMIELAALYGTFGADYVELRLSYTRITYMLTALMR